MAIRKSSGSSFIKIVFYTFVALIVAAVAVPIGAAQGGASIWGSVSDASGAVVAGAGVEIKNLETGNSRVLVTDDAGHFNASALEVGRYEVTSSKTGFRPDHRSGITLVVGQREEINLVLSVGDVHQAVEVPANISLVQVTTEDISGVVGEREVKDLPLNG